MCRFASIPAFVLVVLAAAACNSTTPAMTAGGTLSPALSTEPAITTADIALLRSMSPAQQLTHLAIAESTEIAMAQVAVQRTQTAAIANFARRMIEDHRQSLQAIDLIARHENVKLTLAANDTMPAHLARMEKALEAGTPTLEFDGTYMRSQILLHQHVLDELQALQTFVTDPAVRQHVEENIPLVAAQLASAQRVAAQLGYTTAR